MASRKFLCRAESLVEGEFTELETDCGGQPRFLVATRHESRPRAWLNVCPHQGRPLNWAPDKFLKDAHGNLVCAAHGAVFEPADGRCVSGPCRGASLTPVDVIESGSDILIAFP